MLHSELLHPEINAALAAAGHHARVLIADGNYPASTTLGPNARLVSLNLRPGVVGCVEVFETLLAAVPIDNAYTMGIPADDPYADRGEPPVWAEYRRCIADSGRDVSLSQIMKPDFYPAVRDSPDHVLTIQTAETALWANLLLEIGCREVAR